MIISQIRWYPISKEQNSPVPVTQQQQSGAHNPAFPLNRIDENTHLQWDAKHVTKALALKLLALPEGTAYKYLAEMAEKNMIEYDGQKIRTNVTRKYSGEQTQTPIVDSIPCGSLSMRKKTLKNKPLKNKPDI